MRQIVVQEAMTAGVLIERALCFLLVFSDVTCHMPTHKGLCPGLAVLDYTAVITMNSMLGLRYTHLPVVMTITVCPRQLQAHSWYGLGLL